MVIANQTSSHFETLSACAGHSCGMPGKADLKEAIEAAQERRKLHCKKTILFVKEVLETLNRARMTWQMTWASNQTDLQSLSQHRCGAFEGLQGHRWISRIE